MKKFFAKFVKKNCEIIVKETDLVEVLKVLDQRRFSIDGMSIANCGGIDQDKWSIALDVSEVQWNAIRKELLKQGFKNIVIPVRDVFGREYFKAI